ncbi:MAG: hypothetical protein ACJAXQ_000990, partial [Parvibaculaceae bacterium]
KRSKPGAGSVRVIKYGTESQAGSAGGDEYE